MYIIGLTGGIASGKSTVSGVLRELGALIIDTDQIAREIVAPGQKAWRDIVAHFGRQILLPDESLNRRALGDQVFQDSEARKVLEDITHPEIQRLVAAKIEQARQSGRNIVVLDVPLLFETGWDAMTDEVWVVYVDPATQLKRLMQRDQSTREAALARMASQLNLEVKKQRADVLLDNSGDVSDTARQAAVAWQQSKLQAKRKEKTAEFQESL